MIAGLDGHSEAEATFTPMPRPYVGCAGAVLPRSAYAVAGKVYYADGAGIIHSLAPGGQPVQVTAFPLTSSQQMLSFAVSPDGSQLLATIFTLPPKPASGPDPCANTAASPFAPGNFSLDAYAATAGGTASLLYHQDLGAFGGPQLQSLLEFIGWDAVGPLATSPSGWASQGGGPVHYFGNPVRVDATTGKVVTPVSDQSCLVWDIAASGDYACVDGDGRIWVRASAGREVWHLPPTVTGYRYDLLSPDEASIADLSGLVFHTGGATTPLPNAFYYSGWLDSSTLISGDLTKNLRYVNLNDTSNVVDIGFKGMFIGTVRP